MYWAQPWRLNSQVVHSWKAHKGGCRALAVCADEDALLTAGSARAAAQGGDVVRCWRLADLQTGVCVCVCLYVCLYVCMCALRLR